MALSTVGIDRPQPFMRAEFDLVGSPETLEPQTVRCLPDLIHFNATNNPTHVFCLQAQQQSSDCPKFDVRGIAFLELEQAVERCCRWILANVADVLPARIAKDGSVQKSKPVALLMESDVGLFVYVAALLTLNIPCLLLSIRLSTTAIRHLLYETSASAIIVTSRSLVIAQGAHPEAADGQSCRTSLVQAIQFDQFLGPSPLPTKGQAWTSRCRNFVREDDRNVIILHSSGTTGLPKAIPLAHRNLLGYAACHSFPLEEDQSTCGINMSTLPLFHGFGFLAPCLSLSVGKTVCLPPSSTIANGALVISLVRQLAITSLMTVPVIMEDIMSLDYFDDAARVLASLDYIAVGGGGLKPIIGDKLHRKGVKILNHFGATELGALSPIFLPTKDYDYNYLRLRSDLGLKLLVLDPNLHGERACKLIGYPFGWDATFELQDRLQYNPQRPDCEVKILGRNDDVIVLATGEKVVPHLLEHMLEQEPSIKRAIMFGHGQAETGILLEPSIDVGGHEELFLNEMWPVIQKANGFMDGHARISTKTAVLIKPSDKVIPISDKGLPQRKEVYSTFDSEIKSVYKHLERDTSDNLAMDLDFNDKERCIRLMVQSCLPFHRKAYSWEDDDDLIHLGMDSLQATRLRRTLNASLRRSGHKIFAKRDLPLDFVYSHPSVSEMAKALDISRPPSNISKTMEDLAGKYAIGPKISDYRHQGFVILLTGSTGNLGARLLLSLSKIVEVKQIICLVRATPAVSSDASYDALRLRQQQSLKERGMALSESAWSKVGFLPWESGASRLGLDQDTYRHLSSIVTDIFHGAWPMDFKRKLPSFEPQIQTVKDLVQLGREIHHAQSGLRPRVILASSIAAVGRFSQKGKQTLVPETVIADPTTALPMGYAQAKWVCEQVMESAHRSVRCEIKPMILRIGQLSGSQATGYWSTQEHIAAMVRASQVLGRTPDLKGSLSWMPVDQAAQTISDILLRPLPDHLVMHLENPVRQSWQDVCTVIERNLGLSSKRLPYAEWLHQATTNGRHLENLPEFFRDHFLQMAGGSLVLDTARTRSISPTLRSVGGVDVETINRYLDAWKRQGFLV